LSSPATPAAPAFSLRRSRHRAREAEAALEAVSFPELVWAHHLRQEELHEEHKLHGPAEAEYRAQLSRFIMQHGPLLNAYWCTSEASAVAITEKRGSRVLGFLWRRLPSIRFHAATDWATRDAPEIGRALHTCETLAIRVSEVLGSTGERIAMQWILSIAGYLLGVVDQAKGKPTEADAARVAKRARAELAQVEAYYDRAGEKTGRLIYFWGMMTGLLALGALAVAGSALYSIFGNFHLQDGDTQTFFICYGMGAVGAVISVMTRMASGSGFDVDYEVGRRSIRRVGSFRPVLGAVFAIVVYFALRGDLIQLQTSATEHTSFFYATVAFLAGFSERWVKILLGGAQRVLAEEKETEPKVTGTKQPPAEGGGVD
jgi:uncharacterized membrane protein